MAQSNAALAYAFTTLAGKASLGRVDGTGDAAKFFHPQGIAVDSAGNVYVADTYNQTIRKITRIGTNWVVSTLAGLPGGSGTNDGSGSNARFYQPAGLAVDSATNLYVADAGNHTIRKITPVGNNWLVSTLAGSAGNSGSANGMGSNAQFNYPSGVAVDRGGNLYVADYLNQTIRKITAAGVVSTLAGLAGNNGSADGTNSNARFSSVLGIAVDSATNVYVTDSPDNDTIRKITPVGTNWVVTTLAGSIDNPGSTDGTNDNARFSSPHGIAVDNAGNLYVADTANNTIRKITEVGANWVVTTLAGFADNPGSADGTGSTARFDRPSGIAVDNVGELYVADSDNNTIRNVSTAGVVSTLAGFAGSEGNADGPGSNARFAYPEGIAADNATKLYVADTYNHTIRKITPVGTNWVVSTLAGLSGTSGTNDGTGTNAGFNHPASLAVDSATNLYVADAGNHTVRKITPVGTNWLVSTIAGFPTPGTNDGTGSGARFSLPWGIAVDNATNLYVADSGNNNIRKLTPVGTNWTVSTLAGFPTPGTNDGTGSSARFSYPQGIAVDSATNLYVADNGNKTIRKITQVGTNWAVSTIAGSATNFPGGADGMNSAAQFYGPAGIAVDTADNVYVADSYNNTIRRITQVGTNWVVSTLAGLAGNLNYGSADGTGSDARFYQPEGIALDSVGNLYVADTDNNTIRKGYLLPGITLTAPMDGTFFTAPATIGITAQAFAFNGFISNVTFYSTGQPLGTNLLLGSLSYSLPGTNNYSVTWTNDIPGGFALTAVATDNQGSSVTSAPVNLGVVAVVLVNGQFSPSHSFSFLATNSIQVTMTNPLPGGHVLYTTDGSSPANGAQVYAGAFNVTNSVLIRAATTDSDFNLLGAVDPVSITVLPLYDLTNSTLGGGSVTPPSSVGQYPSNAVVTLTATASNGWTFMRWIGDVVTSASAFDLTMNGNKSEQAVFGTGLNIRPSASGYILASPNTNLYPYGSTVRLTAVPYVTNYFSSWQGDVSATNTPLNFTVTVTNPTIIALFSLLPTNQFSLNVQIGSGDGSVARTPSAPYYTNGSSVTLTATPATNQVFVNWSGDASGAQNPLSVTMTNNKTVVANFNTPAAPYVAITNPVAGAALTYGVPIMISATATSSVGSVTVVGFYAGGSLLGTLTNAPFNFSWTNAPPDTNVLTAVATSSFGLSATSPPVTITVNLPPPGPPVFTLSASAYTVFETNGSVAVTILKSFNSTAGTVNYTTAGGTAVAVVSGLGNYGSVTGSWSFASNELGKSVVIPIRDNSPYYLGDRTFSFSLALSGTNGSLGTPHQATVTIVDVNLPPSTNSLTTNISPMPVPPHTGQLTVSIVPTNSGGQWRLVREIFWRNSGESANNLASGTYEVEFEQIAGFLAPANTNVAVIDGLQSSVPALYAVPVPPLPVASLMVNLQPPAVANAADINQRGQWRLLGQTNWLDSGTTLTNSPATNHILEFKSVPSYVTPPLQTAIVTNANQINSFTITYSNATSAGCSSPTLVPYNLATNARPTLPYVYCGQLLSDAGYGSGCVVKRRVVLTAAHVVFNDLTLSYVATNSVRWFFERYAGQFEPPTQTPRGWYVLNGYAGARANDRTNGLPPGISSLASQNLDVAALYFFEDAGRGGQSGYLVSDPGGIEWLQSGGSMTMAGYPVEKVSETTRGQIYSTPAFNYTFDNVASRVFRTADICGYPGMSGGPLFVLASNNTYYPAAVYLADSSGETIVRAIDGAVAGLINNADATAHTGVNNTGGGVILVSSGSSGSGQLAYLQVRIGPSGAVAAGGGWRLQGAINDYISDPNYTPVFPSNRTVTVEFNQIPGWNLPGSTNVAVTAGNVTTLSAQYAPDPPVLSFTPDVGLGVTGTVGARFKLEYRTSLTSGQWLPLRTNTLGAGLNLLLPWPPTNGPVAFYRAVWIP